MWVIPLKGQLLLKLRKIFCQKD